MLAQDILDRLDMLKTQRTGFEHEWREAAKFVHPSAPINLLSTDWGATGVYGQKTPSKISQPIYDSTALLAVRQLANGMLSLLMPSTQYWHGLKIDSAFDDETPDVTKEYLEKLRGYLFKSRYNPGTGFVQANQAGMRQLITFGTAIYRVKEGKGGDNRKPFKYQYMPLGNTYIDVTTENVCDTCYEIRHLSARQIIKTWGENNVSAKIKRAADDNTSNQIFEIIHAIQPREEFGSRAGGDTNKNSDFASYIIEADTRHVIEDSGYYEFPIIRYVWDEEPGCPYGISPVSIMLSNIKQTNSVAKSMLIGGQRSVEPPFATVANGVGGNRALDLRPNAPNPGYMNERGQVLAQPLYQGQNPSWAQGILADSRQSVREGLFLNLFQVLQDNPNQTATEALIRDQEKGELLGPVGQSVQAGLSTLVDREIGILSRRNAFNEGQPLSPPEEAGRLEFSPEYTSPLDRARRSGEALGIQRTLEMAMPIAQADPQLGQHIMSGFDFDEIIKTTAEIYGAPTKIFKNKEERDAERQQAQEAQQAQQAMQLIQQGAGAAGDSANAITAGAEAVNASAGAIPGAGELAGLLGSEGTEGAQEDFLDLDQGDFSEL